MAHDARKIVTLAVGGTGGELIEATVVR